MKITSCAITDVGRKRPENQDHYLVDDEHDVYVVADGMGGHLGGEVASRLAVETIEETMIRITGGDPSERLRFAIRVANKRIFDKAARDPDLHKMGTTTVAIVFDRGHAHVCHVGDSRAYRLRAGEIVQVTGDHSVVAEQVRLGILTAEAAKTSTIRNWVTRSVGYTEDVEVDLWVAPLEKRDVFVLCSDGLTGLVEPFEIAAAAGTQEPEEAARSLVDLANERGGDDNVTVLVARVDEP